MEIGKLNAVLFTVGSKGDDKVYSATVFEQRVYCLRLPFVSSSFSTESNSIPLTLEFVVSSD